MSKRGKWSKSFASLEQDLENTLCALRAEYLEQPIDESSTQGDGKVDALAANADSSNHDSDYGSAVVEHSWVSEFMGPNLLGRHIVANKSLLKLLRTYAVAEARGSCQGLLHPLPTSEAPNAEIDYWSPEEQWMKPRVWMRHDRFAAEADSFSLYHWSKSLLSPESCPVQAEIILCHPRRSNNSHDIDNQFVSEFQCLFELCGYGLLSFSKRYSYIIDSTSSSTSWDATCRNLSMCCEEWMKERPSSDKEQKQQRQRAEDTSKFIILVVWPNKAWPWAKLALAACAPYIPTNCRVHLVPEDAVLLTRKRKSRLIGMSIGVYSMLTDGAGAVVLPRLPANESTSPRTHVAFVLSNDQHWAAVSWCDASGRQLSTKVYYMPEENGEEHVALRNASVLQFLNNIANASSPDTGLVIITIGKAQQLIDMEYLRSNASHTFWHCDAENPSLFRCTKTVDVEDNDIIRKELDDLAFLSTISEYPTRGPLRQAMLFTFASQESGFFRAPIHLKCAYLLARYVDGLAVSSHEKLMEL